MTACLTPHNHHFTWKSYSQLEAIKISIFVTILNASLLVVAFTCWFCNSWNLEFNFSGMLCSAVC